MVARVLTVRRSGCDLSLARVSPLYEVVVGRMDRIVFKGVNDEVEVAQLFEMTLSDSLLDCFEIGFGELRHVRILEIGRLLAKNCVLGVGVYHTLYSVELHGFQELQLN